MTNGMSYMKQKEIKGTVIRKLIAAQQCSIHKTDEFNVICYGDDLNILDEARKWLLLNGNDRIYANKLVLYVRQTDIDRLMKPLLAAMWLVLRIIPRSGTVHCGGFPFYIPVTGNLVCVYFLFVFLVVSSFSFVIIISSSSFSVIWNSILFSIFLYPSIVFTSSI